MNVALRRPMTAEAFLEWEARQALRWEFDGWGPVAMAGGTDAHATIQGNVNAILWNGLRGHRRRVRGPDLKVRVARRVRMAATVFRRPGAEWVGRLLLEGSVVEMPEIGLSAPLAEFYAGVDLPATRLDDEG